MGRLALVSCLGAFLFIVVGTKGDVWAAVTTSTTVTSFQADAQHDGYEPNESLPGPLSLSWQRDLGGDVTYPLVADGRVFVVSGYPQPQSAYLWCFDLVTGDLLWGPIDVDDLGRFAQTGFAGIAYDGGRLFVENSNAMVRAFDPATGAEIWDAALADDTFNYVESTAPNLTAFGGVVYATEDYRNGIVALRESDGSLLWRAPGEGDASGGPAVTVGAVYQAGTRRLSPTDGSQVWASSGGVTPVGPPAVSGSRVFTRNGEVVDTTTGHTLGSFSSLVAPAIDTSQVYSLQTSQTANGQPWHLVARGLSDGTTHWAFSGDGQIDTPPLVVNGSMFIGSHSGTVYALDPSTGNVTWSADVGAPIGDLSPPNSYGYTWLCNCVSLAAAQGRLLVPAGTKLAVYQSSVVSGSAVAAPAPDPVQVPAGGAGARAVSFQQDAAHDGIAAGDDTSLPLHRQWRLQLGGPVTYPLIVGSSLYVASVEQDNVAVYDFDVGTGARIWGPVRIYGQRLGVQGTQLAYDAGQLFATENTGGLVALDATTGKTNWSMYGKMGMAGIIPTASKGVVYAGDGPRAGGVAAYSEVTGKPLWETSAYGWEGSLGGVAVGPAGVFSTGPSQETDALAIATGASQWHTTGCCTGSAGYTPAYAGGLVFARDPDSADTARLLDASTGALVTDAETQIPPAFSGASAWVVQTRGLAAYDVSGRRQVWRYNDSTITSAPIVANGNVFAATSDGHLLAVNAATGNLAWSGSLDAPFPAWNEDQGVVPGLAVAHGLVAVPVGNYIDVFADSRRTAPSAAPSLPAPPGRPYGLTTQRNSDGSVTVTWHPPSYVGAGLVSYIVTASPAANSARYPIQIRVPATQTSATISGLDPTQIYGFSVIAQDTKTADSHHAATPWPSPHVAASAGDTTATVEWDRAEETFSDPVTEYKVTATPGGATKYVTATSATFTGLHDWTTYHFSVVAISASGTSLPTSSPAEIPHPQSIAAVTTTGGAAQVRTGNYWTNLAGSLLSSPTVVMVGSQPWFFGVGTNHAIYVRSITTSWQRFASGYCIDRVGVAVDTKSVHVACQGSNHQLYITDVAMPTTGLPHASTWTSLGGYIEFGPAVAVVGGNVTYAVTGRGGRIYTRTESTSWLASSLYSIASPALGVYTSGITPGTPVIAYTAPNHAIYYATGDWYRVWYTPSSVGGYALGGPGIAVSDSVTFFSEGSNHAVNTRTETTPWATLGNQVNGGVGSTAD